MISVKNLTKIYDKGENALKALDNVSFDLPDKGLVFIVGKSGSGKSTLLNMLGGLDDVTSGDVFVNDLNIAKMNVRQLDAYRNLYLGIIYQNYNLFENETVMENILTASDIAGLSITDIQIANILKELDLDDIKDKLVKNLSGGQKQRVAIARALIKNPTLILADEPTGNLDSKTATIIFDLLKKISQERLVIIISHDNQAANDYADRLIRISDGHIIEDVVRYKREAHTDKETILIDENDDVSQTTIDALNEHLKDTEYRVRKKQKEFKPYVAPTNTTDVEVIDLSKTKTNYRNVFRTGIKILKNNLTSLIISTMLSILMIGLLSLSTFFIAFDGASAIDDVVELYDLKTMVLRKGYSFNNSVSNVNKDHLIECDESDVNLIKAIDYDGHYYPIINSGLCIAEMYPDASLNVKDIKYDYVYPEAGLGTVICDMDYLEYLFGENFTLAAGSLYGLEESYKIIVPDYFADAYLFYNPSSVSNDPNDPYQKVVNVKLKNRYTIGAIIKTDYKEKYKIFLDAVEKAQKEPQNAYEITKAISESASFQRFTDDLNSRLNFGYSLNPNYRDDMLASVNHCYFTNSFYSTEEGASPSDLLPLTSQENYWASVSKDLEGDDVLFNLKFFNEVFSTNYADANPDDFEEKTIYIYNYGMEQNTSGTAKYVFKLHIKGLVSDKQNVMFLCSREKQMEMGVCHVFTYGYVFDNVHQSYNVFNHMRPYFFFNTLSCFDAVFNTINIITIFSEVFTALMFVLLGVLMLIIVMHSLKTIKKEQYRFGVYKSLGYSNEYLTLSLLVSSLFMIVTIFIFSTIFTFGMSFLVNRLLQAGFHYYTGNTIYFYITLLAFRFDFNMYFNLAALGLTLLSSFIPLLKIRKIKPNKIIKNAE